MSYLLTDLEPGVPTFSQILAIGDGFSLVLVLDLELVPSPHVNAFRWCQSSRFVVGARIVPATLHERDGHVRNNVNNPRRLCRILLPIGVLSFKFTGPN